MTQERIEALRVALAATPQNHPLRQMLAEALLHSGDRSGALAEYERLIALNVLKGEDLLVVAELALAEPNLAVSGAAIDQARKLGLVEGVADLSRQLSEALAAQNVETLAEHRMRVVQGAAEQENEDGEGDPGVQRRSLQVRPEEITITFSDVGGLADVKKTIHRMIILPFQRPELYQKYNRKSGGGVLLYGPPGCGKTMLARATAGECRLPFFNIRIEEILEMWVGNSERNLHQAFQDARDYAPCVLFIDEIDALAYARRKQSGAAQRSLVNVLLEELDSIGSDNTGLLIIGATNAPWDVDDALSRPGRFDRTIFVPPPDVGARERIMEIAATKRPVEKLNLKSLAKQMPLCSGADVVDLFERAIDFVIDEALDTGKELPLNQLHLENALAQITPSTLEWLTHVRNYVEFANQGDRYKDVEKFLKSSEIKQWNKILRRRREVD